VERSKNKRVPFFVTNWVGDDARTYFTMVRTVGHTGRVTTLKVD
jgi:hypothetical protein